MAGNSDPSAAVSADELAGKGRRARWWLRKGSKPSTFYYVDKNGKRLTKRADLERIASIVIPPAWKYVRINPAPRGRIQAVGIDTSGRLQYIYHPAYAKSRQRKKFEKIERFGEYLSGLREITNEHIGLNGFPREKVLAIAVRLMNSLYFRVGTEKSVKKFRTFGLTTLRNDHLSIGRNGELRFAFTGKSRVKHRKVLVDTELASVMKELKGIGAKRRLFHFINGDGKPNAVTAADVNRYIKEHTSAEFSSKDLRTWGATLIAAAEFAELGPESDPALQKKNIVKAIKKVADEIGNTPAVCRGSYVHPAVIDAYESGVTLNEFRSNKVRRIKRIQSGLEPEEKALLELFKKARSKG